MSHYDPYDTAEVEVGHVVDGDGQNRGDFSLEIGKEATDEANSWRVTRTWVFGY